MAELDSCPLLQDEESSSCDELPVIKPFQAEDRKYNQLHDDDSDDGKVAIPRHLGLVGCIWHIIGTVIGTGIFISPTGVLRGTGGSVGWALVIWVICAIIHGCGALIYTELALMFRKSGGEFTFLLQAWGPLLAFVRLWILVVIISPGAAAIQALVISKYLLTPFFQCVEVPLLSVRLISACCVLFFVFVNCVSVNMPARLAGILTVSKMFGLLVVIVSGIYNLTQGHTTYIQNAFATGNPDIMLMPIGVFSGLFAYSGWEIVTSITEEVDRPARNIPLSLLISMTTITLIYILANIAYFTLLSPQQILESDAVAADYSVLALGRWSWLIWIFVALSAMGNLNSGTFARGRMVFVAAREGLFPEVLAMVNIKYRTPLPAILMALISLIYLIEDDVIVLIQYLGFVDAIFITMTVAILPYYRWKYPDINRPFKIPLFVALIYISAMCFVVGMSVYSEPIHRSIGLGIAFTGVPIYFIFVHPKYKLKCLTPLSGKLTQFLQKVFFSVHQEKKTF